MKRRRTPDTVADCTAAITDTGMKMLKLIRRVVAAGLAVRREQRWMKRLDKKRRDLLAAQRKAKRQPGNQVSASSNGARS